MVTTPPTTMVDAAGPPKDPVSIAASSGLIARFVAFDRLTLARSEPLL
jgi:hypothetical protein